MSNLLKKIFGNIAVETGPTLFGWQHWLFIVAIFGLTILFCLLFKNKPDKFKDKVLNVTAVLVISVYIFDLFVQPFWNDGELAIHKLPFHICTLLGILVPFVNYNKKLSFAKQTITVWAILAPLMFILFPLNYINRPVAPYSYTVMQTFIFHGLVFFWGVFMLVSKKVTLKWKDIWQPIVGLAPVAAWATLGQEMYYPGRVGENFLFLRTDISAYAPQWLLVPLLFVGACIGISLLYAVNYLIIKLMHSNIFKRKTNSDDNNNFENNNNNVESV